MRFFLCLSCHLVCLRFLVLSSLRIDKTVFRLIVSSQVTFYTDSDDESFIDIALIGRGPLPKVLARDPFFEPCLNC